jgi:tetratricopeptide (TPR) repeat protein
MLRSVLLAAVLVLGAAGSAPADERVLALLREGNEATYNLDYDRALSLYEQARSISPDDPTVHRAIATAAWLRIIFQRGTVTVDDYMGKLSSGDVKLPEPPKDLANTFHTHIDRAKSLAERAVTARPRDPTAQYDLGAALGVLATYTGSVDGKLWGAFRAAQGAYGAHEKVLELDPSRKDAGLVVGTYRYIVATQNFFVRGLAHLVGFGGDKEKGLRLLEGAASFPSEVQADARFALVLIYNRERRFDDALRMIRALQASFPRNRLLWLEEGATAIRAKRPAEAERALEEGLAKLQADHRPRIVGEEALWRMKRATARVMNGNLAGAREDARFAIGAPDALSWVKARAHVELGKVADLSGDRASAKKEYQTGSYYAERSNDPHATAEAKRLLDRAYTRSDK